MSAPTAGTDVFLEASWNDGPAAAVARPAAAPVAVPEPLPAVVEDAAYMRVQPAEAAEARGVQLMAKPPPPLPPQPEPGHGCRWPWPWPWDHEHVHDWHWHSRQHDWQVHELEKQIGQLWEYISSLQEQIEGVCRCSCGCHEHWGHSDYEIAAAYGAEPGAYSHEHSLNEFVAAAKRYEASAGQWLQEAYRSLSGQQQRDVLSRVGLTEGQLLSLDGQAAADVGRFVAQYMPESILYSALDQSTMVAAEEALDEVEAEAEAEAWDEWEAAEEAAEGPAADIEAPAS